MVGVISFVKVIRGCSGVGISRSVGGVICRSVGGGVNICRCVGGDICHFLSVGIKVIRDDLSLLFSRGVIGVIGVIVFIRVIDNAVIDVIGVIFIDVIKEKNWAATKLFHLLPRLFVIVFTVVVVVIVLVVPFVFPHCCCCRVCYCFCRHFVYSNLRL